MLQTTINKIKNINKQDLIYLFTGSIFAYTFYILACILTQSNLFESPSLIANIFLVINFAVYSYLLGKHLFALRDEIVL